MIVRSEIQTLERGKSGDKTILYTQLRHQEESSRLTFIELVMRAGVVDLLPFYVGRGLAGHSSSCHQRAPSCITGSVVFQARESFYLSIQLKKKKKSKYPYIIR